MLEILHSGGGNTGTFPQSGPGPITLKFGDTDLGYFGEVTQSELFTPAQINASLQNLAGTTIINPTSTWLKFAYRGKFLFIAKQPMFTGVNWSVLYDNGLVYGLDENGPYDTGTPRNQLRLIGKSSFRFKIRTITNNDVDPFDLPLNDSSTYHAGEATDLLYRVYKNKPSMYEGSFASFTDAELGIAGLYEMTALTSKANINNHYGRGNGSLLNTFALGKKDPLRIWRPVLEVVPPSVIFGLREAAAIAFGEAVAPSSVKSIVTGSSSGSGLIGLSSIIFGANGGHFAPAKISLVHSGQYTVTPLGEPLVSAAGDTYGTKVSLKPSGSYKVVALDTPLINSAGFTYAAGAVKCRVKN